MKVAKKGKVIIINDRLKDRYIALGYEVVEEKDNKKKNVNVSAHDNTDKEK